MTVACIVCGQRSAPKDMGVEWTSGGVVRVHPGVCRFAVQATVQPSKKALVLS